jgi:hypothetical protein
MYCHRLGLQLTGFSDFYRHDLGSGGNLHEARAFIEMHRSAKRNRPAIRDILHHGLHLGVTETWPGKVPTTCPNEKKRRC